MPLMSITLPKLSGAELDHLVSWSKPRIPQWSAFATWIVEIVENERERRENEFLEPAMLELPLWTGNDLADALEATFVLARMPATDAIRDFVELVSRHVLASTSAYLRDIP